MYIHDCQQNGLLHFSLFIITVNVNIVLFQQAVVVSKKVKANQNFFLKNCEECLLY